MLQAVSTHNSSFDTYSRGGGFRFLLTSHLCDIAKQLLRFSASCLLHSPPFTKPASPFNPLSQSSSLAPLSAHDSCSRTFWIRYSRSSISSQVIVYPINAPMCNTMTHRVGPIPTYMYAVPYLFAISFLFALIRTLHGCSVRIIANSYHASLFVIILVRPLALHVFLLRNYLLFISHIDVS